MDIQIDIINPDDLISPSCDSFYKFLRETKKLDPEEFVKIKRSIIELFEDIVEKLIVIQSMETPFNKGIKQQLKQAYDIFVEQTNSNNCIILQTLLPKYDNYLELKKSVSEYHPDMEFNKATYTNVSNLMAAIDFVINNIINIGNNDLENINFLFNVLSKEKYKMVSGDYTLNQTFVKQRQIGYGTIDDGDDSDTGSTNETALIVHEEPSKKCPIGKLFVGFTALGGGLAALFGMSALKNKQE